MVTKHVPLQKYQFKGNSTTLPHSYFYVYIIIDNIKIPKYSFSHKTIQNEVKN